MTYFQDCRLFNNANNVCVYTDATGMIKPDKAKSTEKIDGIAALVNGLALASTDEDDVSTSLDDYRITLI